MDKKVKKGGRVSQQRVHPQQSVKFESRQYRMIWIAVCIAVLFFLMGMGIRALNLYEKPTPLSVGDYAVDLWPTTQECAALGAQEERPLALLLQGMDRYMRVGKAFQKPNFNLKLGRFVVKWMNELTKFDALPFFKVTVSKGVLAGIPYIKVTPTGRPKYQVCLIHGGGYILGLDEMGPIYKNFAHYFAHALQATIWIPDYRLAPEHRFPVAFEDCLQFYRALRQKENLGGASVPLVLFGDSAGGGIALALVNALPAAEQPFALVVASPWTDLALTGESLKQKATLDPMLNAEVLPYVRDLYVDKAFWWDPRASPLYGEFPASAPILMIHGGKEILYDDTRRLAVKLRQRNCWVEVLEEPDMAHAFLVFVPFLPHAQQAFERIQQFLDAVSSAKRHGEDGL